MSLVQRAPSWRPAIFSALAERQELRKQPEYCVRAPIVSQGFLFFRFCSHFLLLFNFFLLSSRFLLFPGYGGPHVVVNQTTLIALINVYSSSSSWVWPPLKSNPVWTADPALPLGPRCYDMPRTINIRTLNIQQRKFQVQFLIHLTGHFCITGAITIT